MQKETNYYHPQLFMETEFIKRSWFCCVTSSGWISTVLPVVHVLFIFTRHTSFIRVLHWIYLTRVIDGSWIAQWRYFFSLSEVRIKEVDRRINAAIVRARLLSRLQNYRTSFVIVRHLDSNGLKTLHLNNSNVFEFTKLMMHDASQVLKQQSNEVHQPHPLNFSLVGRRGRCNDRILEKLKRISSWRSFTEPHSWFNLLLNILSTVKTFFTFLPSTFSLSDFSASLLLCYLPSHLTTWHLCCRLKCSYLWALCAVILLSRSSVRGYTGRQRLLGGWRLVLERWDLQSTPADPASVRGGQRQREAGPRRQEPVCQCRDRPAVQPLAWLPV